MLHVEQADSPASKAPHRITIDHLRRGSELLDEVPEVHDLDDIAIDSWGGMGGEMLDKLSTAQHLSLPNTVLCNLYLALQIGI